MLLTISTTHVPATDLGFLLRKNPDSVRSVELWFGHAENGNPKVTHRNPSNVRQAGTPITDCRSGSLEVHPHGV
jgi:hypothetical protein